MTQGDRLIKRIKREDGKALEELIAMYYPDILRYCLWHAPNHDIAQDATQETFLKFIRYIDCHSYKGDFKPFLYRIASNTCIDMWRASHNNECAIDDMILSIPHSNDDIGNIESQITLKQMICELPKSLQELVILRYGQNLTIKEIAAIVKLPMRTVQSRLRAALKQLRSSS